MLCQKRWHKEIQQDSAALTRLHNVHEEGKRKGISSAGEAVGGKHGFRLGRA